MLKRFAISMILLAGLAVAQKPSIRVSPRSLDAAADAAIERDPRLAAERDELDRQMFEMRQALIRDAINKMNNRRFDNSNAESYRRIIGDLGAFLIFCIMLSAVLWLIRTILENRRWSRVAAIQTEIHNKLLEKMASNQELLAYMETEAGKRFLESSPFDIETTRGPSFPYGRILLSAQFGVVFVMMGAGMLWLQDRLPDVAQGLLLSGTLFLALGVGLVFSSFLAYSMSKHFGLTVSKQE